MTYNVLYVGTAPGHDVEDTSVFHFPNKEAGDKWLGSVNAIKHHIGSINDGLAREGREGMGTYNDYHPWIVRCQVFIGTFGKMAVPGDIRRALNSVEIGCGVDQTTWP